MRRQVGINPDRRQMDELATILTAYVAAETPRLAETYTWAIPASVPVPWPDTHNLSLAAANIQLKRVLAETWLLEQSNRYELASWYVRQWCGIRTNKENTLRAFTLLSEEELLLYTGQYRTTFL